jgi:hypothetical protein
MGTFEWFVAKEGYCCAAQLWQDLGAAQPTPTPVLFPDATLHWRRYAPMQEYEVLYRTFAELDPSPEGLLGFANTYGLLGLWGNVWPGDTPTAMPVHGESVAQWQDAIRDMREAVMVWDVLQRHDQEALSRWVLRQEAEDGGLSIVWTAEAPFRRGRPFMKEGQRPSGPAGLPLRDPHAFIAEPLPPHDVWGAACSWLQDRINAHLEAYVMPRVGYDAATDTVIPFTVQLMPKHLYGALWLQFASSLGGEAWDRHCAQCGRWFRVPAKARRQNTVYCSTPCRVKAARQRQATAAGTGSC